MKRFFLMSIMGLLLSCNSKGMTKEAAFAPTVYYYSTIAFVETPLTYIKGSIPLTKEDALQRNHYRFTYDGLHRLVSVAFYNGQNPRNPNHTANLFTLAHRMEFSYGSDKETITFFGAHGEQVNVLGDCREFVYSLDDKGYRKSLAFIDDKDQQVENDWGIATYQWTYLSDGSIIEDRFNTKGESVAIRPGFEFFRLRLYFNPLGHIALMQNIDDDGNLVENSSGASQDRITTNADGNFIKWEVLDNGATLEKGNGPNVAIGIQEFNEYGYEVTLEHRDENNKLMHNNYGICKSRTSFDQFGNIVERRFYDEKGNASRHTSAGYHMLKIQWDASGNHRESLSYYDRNGTPIEHRTRGYHKVRYSYNGNDVLEQISYLDRNEHLVNRKDNGAAYIKYTYDAKGQRSGVVLYDVDGNAIQ
ncbi:hypothetical protein [Flagellimonas sp.]|uniref:hypothetical protein n=1 Tax=Flagellimonas sp. TaxID=2058762 RepID=UPI003BA8DF3E